MKEKQAKPGGRPNKNLSPAIRSKNRFKYWESDRSAEIFITPSITVPDQTLNIKTVFERHRRGMSIPEIPSYFESDVKFNAEIYNLDKQDRIEMLKKVTRDIENAKSQIQDFNDKLAYEKAKAEQEAHAKRIADLDAREKALQERENRK